MNIPKIILSDRKIISPDVYNYYQSLAKRLISKKRNTGVNIISNYSKEKIQNWFSYLDMKQKFKICSIYNNWFSNIIFQMMEYSHFVSVIEFYPTDVYQEFKNNILDECSIIKNELNIIANNEKNLSIKQYDNFITFFRGENKVKKSSGVPEGYELININYKSHNENLFFAELRFITLDEFNDTITFSKDLLNHPERLFEFFNYFSKSQSFSSIINPIQEKNNIFNFSFPSWIYNYQSYSFCQLLLIFFEQIISVYYQLYLYEKEIPQFNIDQKFFEFFKTNESIKKYLSEKIKNNNNECIIDKDKCLEIINSDTLQKKYLYYENKIKFVFSLAFGESLYEQNSDKKRNFSKKFHLLMQLAQKNLDEFVNKITFIESKDSFKYSNFIYTALYQHLIEQCSNECYKELLIEENNKIQNEPIKTKSKKNKRKKKKKRKVEKDVKEIKNLTSNNDIMDVFNDAKEEKIKDITENNEEEIEEIPADYIINPKIEQNQKEFELTNNNIINNNDINNSTVSSSYTNKYSKDYNNNSLGPRINNFFKCEKKESEMLLDNFTDDKSEDSSDEKGNNNKIELEDISENDISEDNINNNNQIIINEDNKKKKKKHKRRNKKKKNKSINENINITNNNSNNNERIINNNEIISDYNYKEKDKIIINNDIKNNDPNIIINIKDNKGTEKIIDEEIKEIKEQNKEIKEITKKIYEKENNNKNEKIIIKEYEKVENDKHKRKNNKGFFLFPVNNKKKEKNLSITKKNEKKNQKEIDKDKNLPLINKKNQINKDKKNDNFVAKKEEIQKNENVNNSKNNINNKDNDKVNIFEINKVVNIIINSDNKDLKEIKKDNNDKLFLLNQQTIQNSLIYGNFNNSFFFYQNELFRIIGRDILKFQKTVEINLKEINKFREQIIDKFKKFINKLLAKKYFIKFFFYGSYSTGLSIESSDIDILIEFERREKNKESELNTQKNIHDLIFLLNEEFNKCKDVFKIIKINPIYTASIPLLKIEINLKDIIPIDIQNKLSEQYLFNFEDDLLKYNFDFTFLEVDDINKEQIIPSQEIIKFIKDYNNKYENIKPIILVLKRYMQIKKLNSSYQGGISSFSLFLLLASYNQQIFYGKKDLKKNEDPEYLLGQIFYGFFMFYANFNFKIHSIDLKKNNPFILLNEFNENKITLIDPITGLNAAKSTFKIEQIKYVFNNAIMTINDIYCKRINHFENDTEEFNIIKAFLTTYGFNGYFY